MTPKQQYEARKFERDELKHMEARMRAATEGVMMLDMLDRLVTAAERIANAMERPAVPVSTLTFDPNSASGFKVANSFGTGGNQ